MSYQAYLATFFWGGKIGFVVEKKEPSLYHSSHGMLRYLCLCLMTSASWPKSSDRWPESSDNAEGNSTYASAYAELCYL